MQSSLDTYTAKTPGATKFPIAEAREIVRDLMRPSPLIYWSDFLFHATLGWVALYLAVNARGGSVVAWFLISVLPLFRAAIFVHELTHLGRRSLGMFRVAWNVLCGIPLFIPSFLYQGVHNEHHRQDLYGTQADGEYLPFALDGRRSILFFVGVSFLAPIYFFARFTFLTPLSWLNGTLRSLVLERISAFTIDLNYRRSIASLNTVPGWHFQELAACLCGWTFLAVVLSGRASSAYMVGWYCVATSIFLVNAVRTLVAHRYRNPADQELDLSGQLQDSVNITDNPLAVLWAPVGLRYHATHHLIPDLPYHSLAEAHGRLMERFSAKHLYEGCGCRGLWPALKRLWREAGS